MEDLQIVYLYWQRSENAITETDHKYRGYCHKISYNILANQEDIEECINDTYMKLWNTLPPVRPSSLSAYIAKIVRNLSLNLYKRYRADKRGNGTVPLLLDELAECIPDHSTVEKEIEDKLSIEKLGAVLSAFLKELDEPIRELFIKRYFQGESIKALAQDFKMTESKIKSALFRNRKKLKSFLAKEGIEL